MSRINPGRWRELPAALLGNAVEARPSAAIRHLRTCAHPGSGVNPHTRLLDVKLLPTRQREARQGIVAGRRTAGVTPAVRLKA